MDRAFHLLCRVAPVVLLLLAAASSSVDAFAGVVPTKLIWPVSTRTRRADHGRPSSSSSALTALRHQVNEARRKDLLSRDGSHFKLDRLSGSIEFGATANLVTRLDNSEFRPRNGSAAAADVSDHDEAIAEWLRDERGMAFSIWDPKLTTHRGNNIYRLQVMTLQFVTLQLAPWVDVQMKTVLANNNQNEPVFTLQSISYDPNLQLLPGVSVNSDTLGITIEVVGQMRPSSSSSSTSASQQSGVTGAIAFQTTGTLPAPMRLLPEPVLKAATDTINQTVVNFAVRSFQKGARKNYRDFLAARALQRQKQKAAAAAAAAAEAEAASAAEAEQS